ncbi:MAG: hypothetical protein ACT4PL_11645 [Phycisphaerales bacterium]
MTRDPRDTLDISLPVQAPNPDAAEASRETERKGRRFLMLYFRCANQYARAYLRPAGDGYDGRCPTCGKQIGFAIGQGGTSRRTFDVSCR